MFSSKCARPSGETASRNNSSGGSSSTNGVARHPDYYIDDGNLVIQVEYVLFKVFRSSFTRHSSLFEDIFSLPISSKDVEGSSDDNPFHLAGIDSIEFERLLSIIYPPVFGTYKPSSVEEWTSVLHLATRWDFDDIRTLAIKELQALPMTSVDKIVLSQRFNINTPWASAGFTALCQRPQPLTLDEARRLGIESSTRIAQKRERLRSGSPHRTTSPTGRRARDATKPWNAKSLDSPASFAPLGAKEPPRFGLSRDAASLVARHLT